MVGVCVVGPCVCCGFCSKGCAWLAAFFCPPVNDPTPNPVRAAATGVNRPPSFEIPAEIPPVDTKEVAALPAASAPRYATLPTSANPVNALKAGLTTGIFFLPTRRLSPFQGAAKTSLTFDHPEGLLPELAVFKVVVFGVGVGIAAGFGAAVELDVSVGNFTTSFFTGDMMPVNLSGVEVFELVELLSVFVVAIES